MTSGSGALPAPGPAAAVAAERARVQRRALSVLVACQVVGGVGIGLAVAVATLAAQDLSGSDAWAGVASTMITLGGAALAIPLAGLASRAGRRPALALGWGLAAAGAGVAILSVVTRWFPLLLVGLALMGAAMAANLQSRYAATDLAPAERRGSALSIVLWSSTVGSVVGPNLTAPAVGTARAAGLAPMVGPFLVAILSFAVAAGILVVWLRPDPLRTARVLLQREGASQAPLPHAATGTRAGWGAIRASRPAGVAVVTILTGHFVMVAVMAMTPVHLVHHGASLTIVGLTISLHIAGMFALSPVFGVLADRLGRRQVMAGGLVTLVAACAMAGSAPAGGPVFASGLFLLGVGWSAGMVAGSASLSDAIALPQRPSAQGVADSLMGAAGAAAGALSGVILAAAGFAGLGILGALGALPALVLLRRSR